MNRNTWRRRNPREEGASNVEGIWSLLKNITSEIFLIVHSVTTGKLCKCEMPHVHFTLSCLVLSMSKISWEGGWIPYAGKEWEYRQYRKSKWYKENEFPSWTLGVRSGNKSNYSLPPPLYSFAITWRILIGNVRFPIEAEKG